MKYNKKKIGGYLLIQALVFGTVGLILIGGIASWGAVNLRSSRYFTQSEQAFHAAEAGIEYYRWHLAHAPSDYQDGTGNPGPYTHPYYDKDGNQIGSFVLTIVPPPVGSTVVVVTSEGSVLSNPSLKRTIEARLAVPSIAKYAFVANSDMRFGAGTEVFGPIHSNQGIRFDGLAHNLVTSAKADYDDPDHSGANEFGVHTHKNLPPSTTINDTFRSNEAPPTTPVPVRTDTFLAGRQFPVPAVDFNGFASDLAGIKSAATSSGIYLPPSGQFGYNIVLDTNDTFKLYRVKSLQSVPSGCSQPTSNGQPTQPGWGSWSINPSGNPAYRNGQDRLNQNLQVISYTSTAANSYFPFPANGLIFVEDHVWVEGTINTARLTIASARFPENSNTNTSITVNRDLNYTNFDGQDVVSLIAQGNVNVGMNSDTTLDLDAALVAKNGRVGRYYYENDCSPYHSRSTINLLGMIATNLRYGFAYTDGTGYQTRNIIYDGNLLYSPPPSFPLTSDHYSVISWREI